MPSTRKRTRAAGQPAGDPARKKAKLADGELTNGHGEHIVQPDSIYEPSSEDAEAGPAFPFDGVGPAPPTGDNFWISYGAIGNIPLGIHNKQVASCDIEFLQVDPSAWP
ncbi:uncharacterized protein N7483_009457 [Penicillium malachiteum]|uniref:uncharacterized protein n=1 Tax=Penicillium malachiteum TaxID=1324776 RepID=UPI0025488840|nr:uncharacterized protein N7483_009457 [Penicillium malachiteum]KAJ5721523.1 hypothetical protein N7483_009457 [Penicillium malachiteum]